MFMKCCYLSQTKGYQVSSTNVLNYDSISH
jgi:hypothetical protein